MQLLVQGQGDLGRLRHARADTTARTTTTLHVSTWDRIVARFINGHTELPAVIVNRAHARAGIGKRGTR